ncbi:MAG: bifunctional aminotransferase class I/II-fold pyridoxal phosphate-dependent enzyme/GNAT family N-acetyltransferase [Nannocystaceae bacterium]
MKDEHVATLEQIIDDIKRRELGHHSITQIQEEGRRVVYDGRSLLNFGSCSYLGLEHHPALREAAIAAIDAFGFQLSSSRAFASLSLYERLESQLGQVFGQPCVATMNTTLGHQTALPILVGDRDALILDLQVHTSVQTAAKLCKADGIPVDVIRHNSMAGLERKLRAYRGKYERVWYLADGVYSMFGDSAPLARLQELLDEHPHLHLYIDDAHGFGWRGDRGQGWVRSQMAHHARMVMAVSFNKSYGCAGGCVIFPDEEKAELVRKCGGPFIFCGPIPAPVLGALTAAADLFLSGAMRGRQAELAGLVELANRRTRELGIPQYDPTETPLFFIPMGLPRLTFDMAARLRDDGLYCHVGSFPATPMKQSGLRFMITANHRADDVEYLLARIRHHYPQVVRAAGTTCAEIARHFGIEPFDLDAPGPAATATPAASGLEVEVHRSIDAVDPVEWDRLFLGRGNLSCACLRDMERAFHRPERPEEHCDFYYVVARDRAGVPVLATMFTHSLMKDDMFAPADVSAAIEAQRAADPHYLTSRTIGLGAPITKGRHLYLAPGHPQRDAALAALVAEMERAQRAHGATQLLLREFLGEPDPALDGRLFELGLSPIELPKVSRIESLGWADREAYLESLGARYRGTLRREVLRLEHTFEVSVDRPRTSREIDAAYRLYRAVASRSFELNLFPLPRAWFERMCENPQADVLRLYDREARAADPDVDPVAVMFSTHDRLEYTALVVGLDEAYVRSRGSYKQILFQTVMRANALGCASLDLAFTADAVKKKVGARPQRARAYIQRLDHHSAHVIDAMSRRVA